MNTIAHACLHRGLLKALVLLAAFCLPALSLAQTPTVSISASPAAVAYGATTTLTWSSTNASYCAIPWGSSATSGSYVTPQTFTNNTYTITCYGPGGSQSASVTVVVSGPPPAPVVTLSADPAVVTLNGTSTLSWASTNATYCNTPWGSSATSGSYLTPPITYVQAFTVTCSGYGGSGVASVTLSISKAPVSTAPTVTLTANPSVVAYNGSTTLSWSSSNASSCVTPGGATAISGSYTTPALTSNTTYSVTCTGSGGTKTASTTVTVGAAPPVVTPAPTVSIVASPASIAYGTTSTLSWSSTNASACTTPWGATATSGSYTTPALLASTGYTLTCAGPGGSQSASLTVTVAAAPQPPPTSGLTVTLSAAPLSVAYGATTRLTWASTNATVCSIPWGSSATSGSYTTPFLFTSTNFSITCYGPSGSQSASVTVVVSGPPPAPIVTLSANPATVSANATTTLTWGSTYATSCNTPWGSSSTSGSYTTPPITYSQAFTVTCSGYGGSNAAAVSVRIGASTPPPTPAPTVTLTANPTSVAYNGSSTLSWSSTNATSCSTPWGSTALSGSYTTPALTSNAAYAVTCTGAGGSNTANVTVSVGAAPPQPPAAPVVTLTANPVFVAYNASSTLNWTSSNATACSATWGATAISGSYTTPALTAATAYSITCSGAGGSQTASVTVSVAPPPTSTNPPIILNATGSGRPGDVISLQGDNFGATPFIYLESAPAVALEIVNHVGNSWLAVQIPASAQGALTLHVQNATGTSAAVKLNAARPLHLDTVQLVPGGAFRLFGRNLLLPGSTPNVTVNGLPATVNLGQSDEHMLTLTAPAALQPSTAAVVLADNGNGSGAAQLDRTIAVVAGSGDPFGLGLGWGAGFASFSNQSINAATDSRLPDRVTCDGSHDDTYAIRSAIDLAANSGGGVVLLPAGQCRMAGGMELKSKVVVQGAGKTATTLVYESNYPVFAMGVDLSGIRNLTLTNKGTSSEGPLLKNSSRVFIQNVSIHLNTSRQMYLDGNTNFAVLNSDFEQTGSISLQGPYILNNSSGLVFEGNTTKWMNGAPTFGMVHDSYLHNNHFTRDGAYQNAEGVVHSMTLDFAHRTAVVGNTFDIVNGPITNTLRNDGETILTEGGGASRTENTGTVASATANTLYDPSNTIVVDPFGTGSIPENYGVAIVSGKGAGQMRHVVGYASSTLTVDSPWDITPDSSSNYVTFVFGMEKALIKNNTLSQNPRGIWLYQTAIRDVEVVDNTITDGGGIYLRTYQNLSTKSFMPIYNVLVARNKIVNVTGHWMSYVNTTFANTDAQAFGIASLGIEMRSNEITAFTPNVTSSVEEYASTEGFTNQMRVENFYGYQSSVMPRVLGTILQNNRCTNCDASVRISTGAGGTTIINLLNSSALILDSATTSSPEKSTDTVIR